jgi:hypothetical protein
VWTGGFVRRRARFGIAHIELSQLPGRLQRGRDLTGQNPPIGADAGVEEVQFRYHGHALPPSPFSDVDPATTALIDQTGTRQDIQSGADGVDAYIEALPEFMHARQLVTLLEIRGNLEAQGAGNLIGKGFFSRSGHTNHIRCFQKLSIFFCQDADVAHPRMGETNVSIRGD